MKCSECTLDGKMVLCYRPTRVQYPVLWVGQAPGKVEVVTGIPFTGGAGKTQYSLMKSAGLTKSDFAWTNIVQCKPPDDGKGNDRAPTPQEIKCCIRHLYEEIWDIKPQLIVALGGPAMQVLTGQEGIMRQRGSFHPLKPEFEFECEVLCLLHPAFVMRQRQWFPIAISDLKLVHDFFLGNIQKEREYEFLLDPTEAEIQSYISKGGVHTVDIETTSLDPFEADLLGLSLSNSVDDAMAVYFISGDSRLEGIKKFLENSNIPKSFQNGSFDCKVLLQQAGIDVQGICYDTRLAEQLLNSDMPKDLDHLRAVYTKIKAYKPTKKEFKQMGSWPKEKLLEYNCWDSVCTYQVMEAQKRLLSAQEKELLETLLVPLIKPINSMELKGVKVDVDTLAALYAEHIPQSEILLNQIQQVAPINPNSPQQLREYFRTNDAQKLTLEHLIKKGHPESDLIDKILRYKDLTKGAGTFLKGVYDRLKDGRIHTQYNIEGTGTGRLSSENPNLQNVPKPYRAIYIPDDPASVFISGDYSQLELWVVALLGPCQELYDALMAGTDVHKTVEDAIDPYLPEGLKDRRRLIAKMLVFGTLYGMSPQTVARLQKVSVETARSWQELLFGKYPGLYKYTEDRKADAHQKGFVTTPWGRKRYVQTVPQALNAPVQSSASDVTLSSINDAYYNYNLDLRLQVHDEIVIHSTLKDYEEQAILLKESMERPIKQMFNHRFKAKIAVGYDWYNLQEVIL